MKNFLIIVTLFFCTIAYSDLAPDSPQGVGVRINITDGTGFLATSGSATLFTSAEGNKYNLLWENFVTDARGSYTWNKLTEEIVSISLFDELSGITLTYNLNFEDQDGGMFSVSDPNIGTQNGTFEWNRLLPPSQSAGSIQVDQPHVEVNQGKVIITLSLEKSTDLIEWIKMQGDVSVDENGEISIEAETDEIPSFYRVGFTN